MTKYKVVPAGRGSIGWGTRLAISAGLTILALPIAALAFLTVMGSAASASLGLATIEVEVPEATRKWGRLSRAAARQLTGDVKEAGMLVEYREHSLFPNFADEIREAGSGRRFGGIMSLSPDGIIPE